MAGGTTLKLGYTNPLTDAFGAHPTLGGILDLNDGLTFTLASPDGLEIPTPPRTLVLAGNIRTQGESATRSVTRHNRTVTARLIVGPAATSVALIASIRTLLAWLAAPPQQPITLQYQPFNASTPLYLDVVGAAHNLPSDEGQWLRGQFEPLTITFTCRPGLRGDRITLQNLVANPGFEQPSALGVQAFNDPLANTNAYSVLAGATPTLAANVLTLPAGTRVAFGSPNWGALNTWQIRFQWVTGLTGDFHLHFVDANNTLVVTCAGTSFNIFHTVAGVGHNLTGAGIALTNGAFYWLIITQFPAAPGEVADVQATLYADNAGSVGAQVAAIGPVPTFDAVTALGGRPALEAIGAALAVGGPKVVNPTQYVALFGPGGWTFAPTAGAATSQCSGAWEGAGLSSANTGVTTYPNGPVSSFGAGRIDLPPAGTVIAYWTSYGGGAPLGTFAIPASAGQIVRASLAAKSSGLHATNAGVALLVNEYDAAGVFLRQDVVQTVAGSVTNAGWTMLAGSVTLGANCASIALVGQVADTVVAGESANGIVWFDNAQCWNQTTTGQTTMSWCDLRAAASPAMLVVSGLLGDLPTPAFLALGAYITSLPAGGALSVYVGRKALTSPRAQLVGVSFGAFSAAFAPQGFAQLDGSSYGGFASYATVGAGGWNPRFASLLAAEAPGVYHILARLKTAQIAGNLPNMSLRAAAAQQKNPWFNLPNGSDIVGQWTGGYSFPFTAQNAWLIADAGQLALPLFPLGALTDPTQLFVIPRAQWQDTSGVGATGYTNWQALLPVDGSLLVATVNNPSNSAGAITNSWLWAYADGLLVNRAGATDGPAWTYSVEGKPTPNPAQGAGGAGTQSTGAINVNSGADPMLILDPLQVGANALQGVNQLVAIVSDQAGGVYGCYGEISYSPLYLEPR